MEGKFYKMVVRPDMMYCLEMVAPTKRKEVQMEVVELTRMNDIE